MAASIQAVSSFAITAGAVDARTSARAAGTFAASSPASERMPARVDGSATAPPRRRPGSATNRCTSFS